MVFHIFLGSKTINEIELLAKLGSSHGFYTIFIFIFILILFLLLTNPKHDPFSMQPKTFPPGIEILLCTLVVVFLSFFLFFS